MLTGIDTTKTDMSLVEGVIKEINSYTEDQLEKIQKVQTVYFFTWPLKLPDEDKWVYMTERGLQHQLDKFDTTVGMLYYISFKSGKFDINKIAVFKTWDSVYGEKVENETGN